MLEHIKVKVLNGSAVVEVNGMEVHVTTGESISVPVPDGYVLIPKVNASRMSDWVAARDAWRNAKDAEGVPEG